MMKVAVIGLMTLAVSSSMKLQTPVNDDDDFLNLDPEIDRACKTKNNQTGICVNERECNEDHTLEPGGIIDNSDLRAGSCYGQFDWCCTIEMTTKRPKPTKPPKVVNTVCLLDDKTSGVCVLNSLCQTAELGGVITDKELRSSNCPSNQKCCKTEDVVETPIGKIGVNPLQTIGLKPTAATTLVVTSSGDKPPQVNPTATATGETSDSITDQQCPLCVALYRIGGHPLTMSASGLFCGGIIITPRVILTSASCVSAARRKVVWVQVPGVANPEKRYNVTSMVQRPGYNSGTKEYDIGLFLLSEDVALGNAEPTGLKFTSLRAKCTSVGFDDDNDSLIMTQLQIKGESCSERGNAIDVACGSNDQKCIVSPGSPVICSAGNGKFLAAGVAKDKCDDGLVMLTSLEPSVSWITEHKWMTQNTV